MKEVSWGKLHKFSDTRGYFAEVFRASKYEVTFVQDNLSVSEFGVLRGFHYLDVFVIRIQIL